MVSCRSFPLFLYVSGDQDMAKYQIYRETLNRLFDFAECMELLTRRAYDKREAAYAAYWGMS